VSAYATGLLRRMLEIPSPSYQEAELAAFLVGEMTRLGFDAHVDAAGNAVGRIGTGDGPTVMLLGHLDTVPEPVPVRCVDGRLYGRGAADAKGPLAAMVCAAAGAGAFPGQVVLVGAVQEETPGSAGAMAIRATHDRPDAVIVGEPSGWSSVVLGYKGKLDLRYRARCAPTHPSSPVPKASELAAAAWTALRDALGRTDHTAFDLPGITLNAISGDTVAAEADLTVRTPPGFATDALLADLRQRLPVGELTVLNAVRACRVDRRNPTVRALSAGIRTQLARPAMRVKTATSDMNTLAEVWDIPMATYGPGDSRLDHADDEHILLADYLRGVAVLEHALGELAGLHPARPGHRPAPVPAIVRSPR
jgi:[amino group carrier protein]-lysine/ornithine hydrolase